MSKRSVFTTITPLPAGVSRATVMDTLRNHLEMIDLNPLVIERTKCKPPPNAQPDEFHAIWYQLKDKIQYLPGGLAAGDITYSACFHDLPVGLQTHVYAPLGLDIKNKWSLGGSLPGEPAQPVELGLSIPKQGLYLREDVDMRCNILLASFTKKTLKKAHSALVDRLVEKAKILARDQSNEQINNLDASRQSTYSMSPASSIRPASAAYSAHRDSLSAPSLHGAPSLHDAGVGVHRFSSSSVTTLGSYAEANRSSVYTTPEMQNRDSSYQPYRPASVSMPSNESFQYRPYQPQSVPSSNTAPPLFIAELPAELANNVPAPLMVGKPGSRGPSPRNSQIAPVELAG